MDSRQRVLTLEHDGKVRDLISGARLGELDVDLTRTERPARALVEARRRPPDLMLIDLSLADDVGFDVARRLRRDERTGDVPVIFFSVSEAPGDKVRAFEEGAVDCVTTPFHVEELRARVRLALRTRALLSGLEARARTDALTGLPNRALLTERLTAAIRQARRRPDYKFALLFLDFDRFKIVNDSLGHEVGDMLLMSIAERLKSSLTAADARCFFRNRGHVPARLGGDEFVVLLDGISEFADAITVAESLQDALSAPHRLGEHEVTSTASIGIVTSAGGYRRADDVLRDADTAMYHAKGAGKARHVVFDDRMHHAAMRRLKLEAELRRAAELEQFSLEYQPIVELASGRLIGFEALFRWSHPERGEVPPGEFIPLAEEIGLIVPMGRWALGEAARRLRLWQQRYPARPPLAINVNVSRRQLVRSDLVSMVREVLAETGIDPRTLRLEITESVIMDEPEEARELLAALKALGIGLCMDDFGTGHSSLSCLHVLPIDVLKIDRTFVLNREGNRQYAAVIHAIITLAHTLGMTVVGEGVETDGQLAQLQALECDCAQGHLFSAPMTPPEAEVFLAGPRRLARSA